MIQEDDIGFNSPFHENVSDFDIVRSKKIPSIVCTVIGAPLSEHPFIMFNDGDYYYYLKCRSKFCYGNEREKKSWEVEIDIPTSGKNLVQHHSLYHSSYVDTAQWFSISKNSFNFLRGKISYYCINGEYILPKKQKEIVAKLMEHLQTKIPLISFTLVSYDPRKNKVNFHVQYAHSYFVELEKSMLTATQIRHQDGQRNYFINNAVRDQLDYLQAKYCSGSCNLEKLIERVVKIINHNSTNALIQLENENPDDHFYHAFQFFKNLAKRPVNQWNITLPTLEQQRENIEQNRLNNRDDNRQFGYFWLTKSDPSTNQWNVLFTTTIEGEKQTKLTIPDNQIEYITDQAFKHCELLREIFIPASVRALGVEKTEDEFNNPGAFYHCWNLETVTFAPNSQLEYIGVSTFAGCKKLSQITIPSNVQNIHWGAFENCASLKEIVWQNDSQLRWISTDAFRNCWSLSEIKLPDNLEILGERSFVCCTKLEKIILNKNSHLRKISNAAFWECRSLTKIVVCSEAKTNK